MYSPEVSVEVAVWTKVQGCTLSSSALSFVVKMMTAKGMNENKFDISQDLNRIDKCVFIYAWVHAEAIGKRAPLCCAHVFLCVLFLQVYASECGLRGKAGVIGQMPSSSQSCVCVYVYRQSSGTDRDCHHLRLSWELLQNEC